jgi:hypothetical protein
LLLRALVTKALLLAALLLPTAALRLRLSATKTTAVGLTSAATTHRPRNRHARRPAMVAVEVRAPVLTGRALVLALKCSSAYMPLIHRPALGLIHGMVNSARTAAKSHMAIHHDRVIPESAAIHIHVVEARADVHIGSVIGKIPAVPSAADKTDTEETKSVVDAAIVADLRSPITGMPHIKTVAPAPITGRPVHSRLRRRHPGAGNPVVAVRPVGPVTRLPHPSRLGARRLVVNR